MRGIRQVPIPSIEDIASTRERDLDCIVTMLDKR